MCPDANALKALSGGGLPSYKSMSGLSLAFVGDAVYELLVRQYVLSLGEARVQDLHRETVALVNAAFQAKAAEMLSDALTEEELSYYKRGRNANSAHTPKTRARRNTTVPPASRRCWGTCTSRSSTTGWKNYSKSSSAPVARSLSSVDPGKMFLPEPH